MSFLENSQWQYTLPQHGLSRALGLLANCPWPLVKNTFIDWFIKRYQVDMSEALVEDPRAYSTFNEFFTRALKAEARPVDMASDHWVSPADGQLSEWGVIQNDQLLQAKGHAYSLSELLAGDQAMCDAFREGHYCTVYLAPRDYHRVHMPCAGTLVKMTHVPGRLFSVNTKTAQDLPKIFARNERVICYFETDFGKMAVILVGAMIVASIATAWHGQVTPELRRVQSWDYRSQGQALAKGAEMGRFYLGSTAIVLTPKGVSQFDADLSLGQTLRMGQPMAKIA